MGVFSKWLRENHQELINLLAQIKHLNSDEEGPSFPGLDVYLLLPTQIQPTSYLLAACSAVFRP